jgi:phospholipid/cholesterol/gamma-HCH transport system substrate-binding protein
MPRTRSLAWSELKIGLLTIVAIVITAVLVISLTGGKGYFWDRYRLKTRFTNVAGLKPGSPVRVAGVEVGSVAAIEFDGAEVEVVLELSRSMRPRVTTASTAFLGSVRTRWISRPQPWGRR